MITETPARPRRCSVPDAVPVLYTNILDAYQVVCLDPQAELTCDRNRISKPYEAIFSNVIAYSTNDVFYIPMIV